MFYVPDIRYRYLINIRFLPVALSHLSWHTALDEKRPVVLFKQNYGPAVSVVDTGDTLNLPLVAAQERRRWAE
jgi:hypothetical protein